MDRGHVVSFLGDMTGVNANGNEGAQWQRTASGPGFGVASFAVQGARSEREQSR